MFLVINNGWDWGIQYPSVWEEADAAKRYSGEYTVPVFVVFETEIPPQENCFKLAKRFEKGKGWAAISSVLFGERCDSVQQEEELRVCGELGP